MTTGLELDAAASVTLPVLEWGEADAPRTALLLHGLSSAGVVWWRVADALAGHGFRVVAPDLRGHGAAPRTLRYPLGALAADALRVRPGGSDAAGIAVGSGAAAPWDIVVGHSLGGALTAIALAHDPGWARAALLVDPALRMARDAPGTAAFREATIAEIERPDATAIQTAHPDWHPEDVYLKVRAAQQTSRHAIAGILGDTAEWDVAPLVARLAVPVTVLGADPALPDAAVSAELGARLAAENTRVRYAVAAGAGHSVHRSHPVRIVDEVLQLAGIRA